MRRFGSTGWLDDIGLPQYKDQFNEGRVDGQMLQYLTVVSLPVGVWRHASEITFLKLPLLSISE